MPCVVLAQQADTPQLIIPHLKHLESAGATSASTVHNKSAELTEDSVRVCVWERGEIQGICSLQIPSLLMNAKQPVKEHLLLMHIEDMMNLSDGKWGGTPGCDRFFATFFHPLPIHTVQ